VSHDFQTRPAPKCSLLVHSAAKQVTKIFPMRTKHETHFSLHTQTGFMALNAPFCRNSPHVHSSQTYYHPQRVRTAECFKVFRLLSAFKGNNRVFKTKIRHIDHKDLKAKSHEVASRFSFSHRKAEMQNSFCRLNILEIMTRSLLVRFMQRPGGTERRERREMFGSRLRKNAPSTREFAKIK
jgi:hypothetical protein